MRRAWMLITLMALALIAQACESGPGGTDEPDYELAVLMLPEGKADAGKEAFLTLGCASCHAVAWEEDLPAPTSPTPGPQLGVDLIQPSPGGVAASITAPSHKVPEMYQKAGGGTVMPDYTQLMTVRQLADIVAYLKKKGLETQTRTGPGGG